MFAKATKLYNTLIEIYADQLHGLEKNMKKKIANRSRPKNLIPKTYGYEQWFTEESDDKTEGDKEGEIVDITNHATTRR